VLGALGGTGWRDGVYLVEKDDGRGELLSARDDVTDCGFGLADPFGQERGAIDDFYVAPHSPATARANSVLPVTVDAFPPLQD